MFSSELQLKAKRAPWNLPENMCVEEGDLRYKSVVSKKERLKKQKIEGKLVMPPWREKKAVVLKAYKGEAVALKPCQPSHPPLCKWYGTKKGCWF